MVKPLLRHILNGFMNPLREHLCALIDFCTNPNPTSNYGDRYRNGEAISSAVAESSVNQMISKRFVKKQQMRWTRRGAHLLLQVRTRVLDDTLTATFQRWYPGMETGKSPQEPAFAAS